MGIQGLNSFLRDKFDTVHKEISLADYRYKKIAIDTSLYMFKFKTVFGDTVWLNAFINLVICLRKNDIHCLFVYDTVAPIEKTAERNERKEKRDKLERDVFDLEQEIEKYEIDSILSPKCKEIVDKNKKVLLGGNNTRYNLMILRQELEKKKRQVIKIESRDFDLTRALFKIMNVPYVFAPSEAEAYCSHLCISGIVDAVLSEDSDVMAYGSPVFLSKINTSTQTVIEIKYENILNQTGLTHHEFKDFCILCGTDYNKNIPKVGPVLSYKLMKEHKSIDMLENIYDISILNHKRVREIFTFSEKLTISIPYCGTPDFKKLEEFCFVNNCRINIDEIRRVNTANIVFI